MLKEKAFLRGLFGRKQEPAERETVMISIGENCLTDDILERNGMKSFSSPYASGRSNVEYILGFEKDDLADFLNEEFLKHEDFFGKPVVRNKKYVSTKNAYHSSCTNGFEFTHYNVLDNEKARETLQRRCRRMVDLRDKNLILVYHHRMCADTNEALLASHLNKLADIYRKRHNQVRVYAFTQVLVTDAGERRIERSEIRGVHFYKLYTLNEWSGSDQEIFWARCDDDLLAVMVEDIRRWQAG